ncbi:MAG: hypothetical protein KKB50_09405 [Planctomycetes bacterium]|nr:hypothetical protein [Planctomycetota bacterium]
MTPSPQELKLTPDLLEYAKAVALNEARKRCPKHVDFGDVVGESLLHLMSKPPRYDPARGASPKTLIYTIVQRAVLKYVARQCREARRLPQFPEPVPTPGKADDRAEPEAVTKVVRERMIELTEAKAPDERGASDELRVKRTAEFTTTGWTTDDVLQYIDNEESRTLCRLFIEYNGNRSAVARRLGLTEGAVRHRLKMLAPKLLAAGFNPFSGGGTT